MEKIVTICRNNDFRRAYARGKSFVGPLIVTYARRNGLPVTRIGVTTSKKVGNAVERNRSRRVIREAYRHLAPEVKKGFDLVFVARGRTARAKTPEVEKQLKRQLSEAGAVKGEGPRG